MRRSQGVAREGWELQIAACIIAVTFLLVIGGWVFSSHMEARAYERVTGKRVSTWDAMFIELRVQEGAK